MKVYKIIGSMVVLIALFFSIGFSSTIHVLNFSDAMAYYKMNETGDAVDYSEKGVIGNLTQTGTVANQAGKILSSRGTYSTSDYFSKSSLSLWTDTQGYSISMWVYVVNTSGENKYLVSSDNAGYSGFSFWIHKNSTEQFKYVVAKSGNSAFTTLAEPTVENETWYFLTAVYDPSNDTKNIKLWLNGNYSETYAEKYTDTGAIASDNIFVGVTTSPSSPADNMYIEQLVFWNKTLSRDEIEWLYNEGNGRNYNESYDIAILNLSIGLSEPADGTRSMSSPIDFSYAVLSNYDVLNCSLVTDSFSEGGGWSIKQYNQTPIVTGGALNYFQLSGLPTKDSFTWTVACTTAYAPSVQYLGGNRTYIYDPMYAGDVATNILRLAPILLGLFVVMMTFVWVMTRESEEFLSVMIQMAVLYLVLAVMLTIIFSILG
jgi:hypothetical protein